jgi:hypothetical protein
MPPKTQAERAAVLEERFDHFEKRFEKVETKVDQVHEFLMQAKGARWAILLFAGAAGFISAKAAPLLTWLHTGGVK